MLLSPRKNGLDSLFKEVRAFKELPCLLGTCLVGDLDLNLAGISGEVSVLQRESNMHRTEGHHFASRCAPYFVVGGTQWTRTGDSVDIVGLPTEKGGFPVPERADSPWGKGGRRRHKMVTTIWCMFDSPWVLSFSQQTLHGSPRNIWQISDPWWPAPSTGRTLHYLCFTSSTATGTPLR